MTHTSPPPTLIAADSYRRVRWKNGQGWTREIVSMPVGERVQASAQSADNADWDWRLSIAEIEQDAAFSSFPGVSRILVLLTGNGLRLRFADGKVSELTPPYATACFAGEQVVHGELVDGPTTDFNLMWKRDAIDAELWHRPLAGSMYVFLEPGDTWALHLLGGAAQVGDGNDAVSLHTGDTVLLHGGTERSRHAIDGAGEALLIRLRRK